MHHFSSYRIKYPQIPVKLQEFHKDGFKVRLLKIDECSGRLFTLQPPKNTSDFAIICIQNLDFHCLNDHIVLAVKNLTVRVLELYNLFIFFLDRDLYKPGDEFEM